VKHLGDFSTLSLMGEWREGNAIPDLLNWVLVESGEGWRWAGVPERAVVNASQLNIAMMEGGGGGDWAWGGGSE